MREIEELLRMPSPAPRPQSLAFDGTSLWMGSVETGRVYALDPQHWTVREEAAAPGLPWGMTVVGDELRVLCGEEPDDTRIIRRFVPGHGFKSEGAIGAPEDTGSQLAYDGDRLYVSQFYKRRVLSLDDLGTVGSVLEVPHDICGLVIAGGRFYLVTTDDEKTTDYWLTCIDARGEQPKIDDLVRIPFAARGLAYDGANFWTNHRENGEIVAFAHPG
jgi:outer membrane protein assembly factor BamB